MAINDYHFITHWRVKGSLDEITELLADVEGLPRWWPSVYIKVNVLEPGDAQGIGKLVNLYTKGWLPYTLRWQFRVAEVKRDTVTLQALGDFVGRGIWTFKQDGDFADLTYDWKIQAAKPLLQRLSFLLKPIFAQNHYWAMRKGEESLILELARRHAATPEEKARIAPPPQPTFVRAR